MACWGWKVDWLEPLEEGFPPQRVDEPHDLRTDISDELSDHLEAAIVRESRRSAEQADIWRRVLDRFGDPAEVARKLWLDNMRGRIMRQRTVVLTASVIVFACVAMVALAWAAFDQVRRSNQELLARLVALNSETPTYPDRCELTVRLVPESPEAPVPHGWTVKLRGNPIQASKQLQLTQSTGRDGVAKFFPVLPGEYDVSIESPFDSQLFLPAAAVLLPGETKELQIRCPSEPTNVDVRFSVSWPSEFAKRQPLVICNLFRRSLQVGDYSWGTDRVTRVTLASTGGIHLSHVDSRREELRRMPAPFDDRELPIGQMKYHFDDTDAEEKIRVLAGEYPLTVVSVMVPAAEPEADGLQTYKVVPVDLHEAFVAGKDSDNNWKIEIPEQMVETIEKQLARPTQEDISAREQSLEASWQEKLLSALTDIPGVRATVDLKLEYQEDLGVMLTRKAQITIAVPSSHLREADQEISNNFAQPVYELRQNLVNDLKSRAFEKLKPPLSIEPGQLEFEVQVVFYEDPAEPDGVDESSPKNEAL